MTTWITICDTCKRESWDPAQQPQTDGEVLAGLIEQITEGHAEINTRRVSCMMGCQRACNVAVQGPDKLTYVMGLFEPNSTAAEAIVAYAKAFDASKSGRVPFREWPQEVKGHFTSRTVPLPPTD